jgi:hypothetical protein
MYGDVWLALTFDELLSRFSCVPKSDILICLHSIPRHLKPSYRVRSIMDCRQTLLRHIYNRLCYLSSLTNRQIFQVFYSVQPSYTDRLSTRTIILTVEYGVNIILTLQTLSLTKSDISSDSWRREKQDLNTDLVDNIQRICSGWPSVVPDDIVFDCLEQYRREIIWILPFVCCVCGLRRPHDDVEEVVIRRDCQSSLDFTPLHVRDSYIVDSTEFEYGFPSINGSVQVLEKSGFKTCDKTSSLANMY